MRTVPLSAEELARIPEFIEKWTAIGLSTKLVDRDRAEAALARFYECAGLSEPWVVWAPCPFSALLSVVVFAAITGGEPDDEPRDPHALDRMIDRVIRFGVSVPGADLADGPMRVIVRRVVGRALRLRAIPGGYEPPQFPTATAYSCAFRAARYARLDPALEKSLNTLVAMPIDAAAEAGFGGILRRALQPVIAGLDQRLGPAASAHLGAPLGLGYAAQMDYANQILAIPLDRSFIDLVESCGHFWVLDGLCIAAERPSHINRDEAGHLHCEVGPSIAFRSGCRWWHWHGTAVDPEVIEEPQRITIEAIERIRTPHLRRILIERYRHGDDIHGVAAYLRDGGGIRVDCDDVFGTLWCRSLRGDEPIVMVEVVNHTPEPDGSYKHHFLRVDPALRPLLGDGSFGPGQPLTARNAVASTFGLRGAEYLPEQES